MIVLLMKYIDVLFIKTILGVFTSFFSLLGRAMAFFLFFTAPLNIISVGERASHPDSGR